MKLGLLQPKSPYQLLCSQCICISRQTLRTKSRARLFSKSRNKQADDAPKSPSSFSSSSQQQQQPPPLSSKIGTLSSKFHAQTKNPRSNTPPGRSSLSSPYPTSTEQSLPDLTFRQAPPPHHLHVYATKHNCHITLSSPTRQPLISVSSGNIGFRKAARGSYDAGYQLAAYVMGRIQQKGLLKDMQGLELILRDFGPGREAVTKILMGTEGRALRGRILRVMDSTKLKFGGTRGKKPRRLG